MDKKKIGVISLGCDKNRIDTEKMLYELKTFADITNDINLAQIIVINTCSFLAESRKEAIETILDCNNLRQNGILEKIIVTGCLPQKFIDELFEELVEVDLFLGTADYSLLSYGIEQIYKNKRLNLVKQGKELSINRVLTTPSHYAYLKVAEGCNNFCTYCLIPSIRGKIKSYPIETLKQEIAQLGEVEELILVAQDLTSYGVDIYGKPSLVKLIKEISDIEEVKSIRLLYCYPELITEELIEEINNNEKVIKYIDIPLQHADNAVLKRMNRKGTRERNLEIIKKLQSIGVAVRSTFIAGFPGETESQFNSLVDFIKEAKLFNAGFFAYSKEEGTPAYRLDGHLPEKVKKQRVKQLYKVQKEIVKENLQSFLGKTIKVVCDGIDFEKQSFYGRAYFSAPIIDGVVYFESKDEDIVQGETYFVKINKLKNYDLYGGVIK